MILEKSTMKPLSDIIIIDLTHMLSGPYAGMVLADMGARTIKVEPPKNGELTRALLANDPKNSLNGMGAYFLTLNRNKESVCIDLKLQEGKQLFYDLVKKADVVISNFSPGVTKRLNIHYDDLSKINPSIVTCTITGFGETGPEFNRPAFDMVAQGYGGGMTITGQPEMPPTRAGIPIGDLGGGMFAAIGILGALNARTSTGKGQHVEISMQDCQISLLNYMATMYFLSGEIPGPIGNSHFVHVPYNTFPTKDRWIIIAVIKDDAWLRFLEVVQIPEFEEKKYHTQPYRLAEKDFIEEKLSAKLKTNTCDHWLDLLTEARVPCAPVNDFKHALEDNQALARNMIVDVQHPEGGSIKMPGNPIKMSGTPAEDFAPPPLLGQNTNMVLNELLGLDQEEINKLRNDGIIG
tara:strand:- start:4253 stop:5473 length:1221 start_codon:yes stop_codon:yes gene_type:complete